MYSACKLNKQGDKIQPWHTPFPILKQSVVPCLLLCFLPFIQPSQETGKVVWYSHVFKNFSTVCCDLHKGFSVVNEAEVDVFLELPCFFYDPVDVGHLISGSSSFSKSSLYISKFLVHILLKSSLKDFEHNLASVWNEHNCMIVWTFFGILLFRIRLKTHLFQSCGQLSFPNLLTYWVQHFHSIIF